MIHEMILALKHVSLPLIAIVVITIVLICAIDAIDKKRNRKPTRLN